MVTILICDDDADIVNALKLYLNDPDYRLLTAGNGKEAVETVAKEDVQLVLLDIMMPEMDGMTAMSKIRETSNVPVILLTAKSEDTDKILGLNVGADDYITKPFNPLEVTARVHAMLRRYTKLGADVTNGGVLSVGGIELNDTTKTVVADGREVSLTPKEFEILRLLMKEPGKVFSPAEIYRTVWNEAPLEGNANTVAVHIRHLREKVEIDPNEPRTLKVVFGQGYKMEKGRAK